jgi:predicted nucleotide-binding protein (sugar kinase/HSP70/actin superfamily)
MPSTFPKDGNPTDCFSREALPLSQSRADIFPENVPMGSTEPIPNQRDREISERLAAERRRLLQLAGLKNPSHFERPRERAFTADERSRVTILFGGLTWKHEKLIQAVFQGSGYRCEALPNPGLRAYHLGKQFGNPGECNPAYFTVGNLIAYLRGLEESGLRKEEIVDNYVFFTSGSCGPCRFGMYESEYRMALENAGFGGFRVLLFSQNDGIKAKSGEPGLKFTVDFGMGMLNAINLGDVSSEMIHNIRPYEGTPGETDRVFVGVMETLSTFLRERQRFEILESTPTWLRERLQRKKKLKDTLNTLGKVREHLYGKDFARVLHDCRERIGQIELDRLRVKPVVKITGEFWAQLTEGDGNFNMFVFLEREGAHVLVDSVGNWITYLMHQAKANARERRGLDAPPPHPAWWQFRTRIHNDLPYRKKRLLLTLGERIWKRQYARVVEGLGSVAHPLPPQDELAELAHPFYHSLARGGEGHLEVGKNVYYTVHHLCHMVLALKPFGCMPSSQSDGVQSAVVSRYPDMIFLPIETAGEGEVNAHSRVQMALGEAKAKAKAEFERCLDTTRLTLEDIRDYVSEHPQLRSPLYRVPRREKVAGVAANFVLHVGDLMTRKAHFAAAER